MIIKIPFNANNFMIVFSIVSSGDTKWGLENSQTFKCKQYRSAEFGDMNFDHCIWKMLPSHAYVFLQKAAKTQIFIEIILFDSFLHQRKLQMFFSCFLCKLILQNNLRIFWSRRDPQGPFCPTLKWMACIGIEPMALVLLAPWSNNWANPHPFFSCYLV